MKRMAIGLLALGLCLLPALARAGGEADAIKALLQRLRKGDSRVVPALAKHGAAAVPGLVEVLKEGNPDVQVHAMAALGQIGPAAKSAVPVLAEGLHESSNDMLATQAAVALGRIGGPAVAELVIALEKGKPERAVVIARAIEQIGPDAKAAEPALVKQLKAAKEPRTEVIFVDALAALGPGAKGAVPDLVELAKTRAKTPTEIHVLVGLGKIGTAAQDAAPYLAGVMTDVNQLPHLRVHALTSLGQVAPSSKALADALPDMIKDAKWPRPVVIATLANTGPVNAEARTVLEQGLSAKDAMTRVYAAQGLGKADPKDRAVVSVLIEALHEKDPIVRRNAAMAIGAVRPTDAAVARTLEKLASDPDPQVRQAAAAALKRLQK
jgi:HEAT repeat protein